jgi:uncharacterized protein with beta-barrel porin domain
MENTVFSNTFTDGERVQAGSIVKGNFGPFTVSQAFTGGYAWYDTERYVGIPTAGITATADSEMAFASSHSRAAYTFGSDSAFIRPLVDIGVTYLHYSGFTESGAGLLSLDVSSNDAVYGTISPGIEFGGEFNLPDGVLLRPFAHVGITHFIGDTTPEIEAALVSGPGNVSPFTVSTDIGNTFADASVGLDVLTPAGNTLRISANGQVSDEVESYGGNVKLSINY